MIPIAFDVLGTCYALDAATEAIQAAFGDQLREKGVGATQIVDDWFHVSQRDFSYISMNGDYTPIFKCLAVNLPKILLTANIQPPPGHTVEPSLSYNSAFAPSIIDPILKTLTCMTPRPSLVAASALLLSTGKFELAACTNGGEVNTRNLFDLAMGKEHSSKWGVWSCDMIQMAKPFPKVYEAIWERLVGKGKRNGWFVASHTWDLYAAKKAGFKTAWVGYEEFLTAEEIFGRPDIVAKDLVDAAEQIIKYES